MGVAGVFAALPRPFGLLAFVSPCANTADRDTETRWEKDYEEFVAAIKGYPYEASQARKDRIIKNYPKLESGMSKEQVADLIGAPDYSRLDYAKEPSDRAVGSSWTYWLRKRDDGVNRLDPCIEIFFRTDDRAHWIVRRTSTD